MIHFVIPRKMDFTIRDYLGVWGRGLAGRTSILCYEDLATLRSLPAGTYVLTALDQLSPAGRRVLGELGDQLLDSGAQVRLLNSPRTTLLRLPLLEELRRRGLNRHRAVRAAGDLHGVRFPVFLHEEHRHNGALTPLLETPARLETALAQAIVRGHRLRDLLVVEFCDTSDAEGFFRKYSAYVVGSEILPRSLERGRAWMLKHARSEFTESSLREEQAYVFQNPHEQELRRIFEAARVEYGRIDYALKDGAIETWEINLHPTIGRGPGPSKHLVPEELLPLQQQAKEHFYRRFQAAFEAIDVGGEAPRQIAIHDVPEGLRQLRPVARLEEPDGRTSPVRRWLRPLRPLADRLAGAVSPILLRMARLVD